MPIQKQSMCCAVYITLSCPVLGRKGARGREALCSVLLLVLVQVWCGVANKSNVIVNRLTCVVFRTAEENQEEVSQNLTLSLLSEKLHSPEKLIFDRICSSQSCLTGCGDGRLIW